MKKIFIGLLVVAAGTGVFFLLRKKKNAPGANKISKELIVGIWQQAGPVDSGQVHYLYQFLEGGFLLKSASDSAKADTARYEWNKTEQLVWKDGKTDSAGKIFTVLKLSRDTLQLQSKDQVTALFIRAK